MKVSPDARLARVLDALAADLLEASDDEIAAVLAERGIKLGMKGSASLLDLIDPRFPPAQAHDREECENPLPNWPPILPRRE